MRRWRDLSGSRNRSHRKRCTSKASRKAEHCGRAWVRELVKMAQESRTSKCIGNTTRDSQDPGVVCNIAREFCDCSGLSADSNAEAFEVDRLLTEFTNLPFQRATELGKATNCWQASSSSFQLSRSWRGLDWLGASEPSKDGTRRLRVFRDGRSRWQSGALWPWKCAGSVVRWRLCSLWSC